MADKTNNTTSREMLLQMEQQWRDLADRAARRRQGMSAG
jgi:hypothetical protein